MLMINRLPKERLLIETSEGTIVIQNVGNKRIRLGIEAPLDMNIVREELVERTEAK